MRLRRWSPKQLRRHKSRRWLPLGDCQVPERDGDRAAARLLVHQGSRIERRAQALAVGIIDQPVVAAGLLGSEVQGSRADPSNPARMRSALLPAPVLTSSLNDLDEAPRLPSSWEPPRQQVSDASEDLSLLCHRECPPLVKKARRLVQDGFKRVSVRFASGEKANGWSPPLVLHGIPGRGGVRSNQRPFETDVSFYLFGTGRRGVVGSHAASLAPGRAPAPLA